jgi:hypothetical protein
VEQFRLLSESAKTFAVEVTFENGRVQAVRGFLTEKHAREWIDNLLKKQPRPQKVAASRR